MLGFFNERKLVIETRKAVFSQPDVLGLCEGGELEVQMFILAQMLIRIPMFKFSTNAPLLQNPCWWQLFFSVYIFVRKMLFLFRFCKFVSVIFF